MNSFILYILIVFLLLVAFQGYYYYSSTVDLNKSLSKSRFKSFSDGSNTTLTCPIGSTIKVDKATYSVNSNSCSNPPPSGSCTKDTTSDYQGFCNGKGECTVPVPQGGVWNGNQICTNAGACTFFSYGVYECVPST